jgi:hypothetical protein
MSCSMKAHVESSLNERSTSRTVFEKTGIDASDVVISEILFDLRIRRFRLGSVVRHARDEREVRWLSSSVRSVIVGLRVC